MFDIFVYIRHWFPIITFCPVNGYPDLIYVTLEYHNQTFIELYAIRKKIRKLISGRKMFMEQVATTLLTEFQDVSAVEVRLAFSRHVVRIVNHQNVSFDQNI